MKEGSTVRPHCLTIHFEEETSTATCNIPLHFCWPTLFVALLRPAFFSQRQAEETTVGWGNRMYHRAPVGVPNRADVSPAEATQPSSYC